MTRILHGHFLAAGSHIPARGQPRSRSHLLTHFGAWGGADGRRRFAHGVWDRSAGQELDVTFSGLDASKTSNLRAYFLINEDLGNFDAAISGEGGVLV